MYLQNSWTLGEALPDKQCLCALREERCDKVLTTRICQWLSWTFKNEHYRISNACFWWVHYVTRVLEEGALWASWLFWGVWSILWKVQAIVQFRRKERHLRWSTSVGSEQHDDTGISWEWTAIPELRKEAWRGEWTKWDTRSMEGWPWYSCC